MDNRTNRTLRDSSLRFLGFFVFGVSVGFVDPADLVTLVDPADPAYPADLVDLVDPAEPLEPADLEEPVDLVNSGGLRVDGIF